MAKFNIGDLVVVNYRNQKSDVAKELNGIKGVVVEKDTERQRGGPCQVGHQLVKLEKLVYRDTPNYIWSFHEDDLKAFTELAPVSDYYEELLG